MEVSLTCRANLHEGQFVVFRGEFISVCDF